MLGYYHSIEPFGTVDGPGIRYVLFLAGCNLRCRFCHNPDTWLPNGTPVAPEQIIEDLQHYRHFYDAAGGGLTISGGEPLLQADFVAELFTACRRRNIHTALDTAGYCPPSNIKKVLPLTDTVLFSIKAANTAKHRQLCGFDNELILKNLRCFSRRLPVIIRYVVIPGLTNTPSDLQQLAELVHSLHSPSPVELLPYHTCGQKKWEALHIKYTLDHIPPATGDDIANVAECLRALGVTMLHQQ
jgi:pyruvate formate lyase activating enzyme